MGLATGEAQVRTSLTEWRNPYEWRHLHPPTTQEQRRSGAPKLGYAVAAATPLAELGALSRWRGLAASDDPTSEGMPLVSSLVAGLCAPPEKGPIAAP